jgi:protein-S-isoprenylcysteine O-methyltransferase Ste14
MKDTLIDWGERLLLVILFATFALANFRSADWLNWTFFALEGLTIFFVLTRRKALSVTENPIDWALAIGATLLPLMGRPGGHELAAQVGGILVVAGGLITVSAKLSLNRRFGLAPANRGVQANWAYTVIRHPMYLGYFLSEAGYLLHNPIARNFAVLLLAWSLQAFRILREERHLMADEAYRTYSARTRFRLVPGLF